MDFSDFVADRDSMKNIVLEKGKFDFNDLLTLIPSTKISNYAFINSGDKRFKSAADSLGLSEPSFSNGAAYGDLDNDGDLDLVVNNLNMTSFVYRNNTEILSRRDYLKIKFKGSTKNPFGIGAQVSIYTNGDLQVLQNFTTRGFESSVAPELLFGLDSINEVDSLVVIWPDLKKQSVHRIKSNQVITLEYEKADKRFQKEKKKGRKLFDEVTANTLNGNFRHRENEFNDFDRERLLPRKLSTEGPRIITGDCNKDGLEDFVLLGAFGDSDKLFLQSKSGQFREQLQPSFLPDSIYESTCGTFFDADNDRDMDLLIGSGGNDLSRPQTLYQLRYYENNGKGLLAKSENVLTSINGNFSCILAEDFDKDGDKDLFLGRRAVPGNYGLAPGSFLIRNDYPLWTIITPEALAKAGMVTDAIWSDIDNDSLKDLIVIGEWMPVMIYKNSGKTLEVGKSIPGSEGWWTTISKGDLNKDGLEDIVLGNWGLNSRFKASADRPMEMYVNDFDKNGKSEFVITMFPSLENRAYPFASKMDMTSQLPMLKKRSIKYNEYAGKSYEELFTPEQRAGAVKYETVSLQSSIMLNLGNSNFNLVALPLEAQVSPVFAIVTDDFDGDGHTDLLLCGNFSGLKHEVARQDANRGVVMKGDGHGNFMYLPPEETGIFIPGEVRDAKILHSPGNPKTILIGRNNSSAMVLRKAQN